MAPNSWASTRVVNTLDDVDANAIPLVHWDGRNDNWQADARKDPWPLQRV